MILYSYVEPSTHQDVEHTLKQVLHDDNLLLLTEVRLLDQIAELHQNLGLVIHVLFLEELLQ
jgi:hypothetical protein